jgi:rRNA maturation protein Rpf1
VLQDTQEVVMAAVGNDGEALFFASERLKNDKTVAMIALAKEGLTHMLSLSSAFVF